MIPFVRKNVIPQAFAATFCIATALLFCPSILAADKPESFPDLGARFDRSVRPLMHQFCADCHSTAEREAELDIEQFETIKDVRRKSEVWVKISEMLDNGDMPPEDAEQPTPKQRRTLSRWVRQYLHAEATANAGDPGPVVLRRLNNAEYTFTIRDLTGVDLNPAREFPADSAAGEGFTNAGDALAMSPALLSKYLDAGKQIARHAVLLPNGFRFSRHATRRDWTDDILEDIRELYGQFVDSVDLGVGSDVGNLNVHGNTRIGQAGRLPLAKYFAATLAERATLSENAKTVEAVARERGLNSKYLGLLWSSLTNKAPSLLMDDLRTRWRSATPEDADALTAHVAGWQKGLWTFGPVGLIGRQGGPTRWMEPVDPLVTTLEVHLPIPPAAEGENDSKKKKDILISLVVRDVSDGNEHDLVVLKQPRLISKGQPDLLIRDALSMIGDSSAAETSKASTVEGVRALDAAQFGKHPSGAAIDEASVCVRAPTVLEIRLPARLVEGREFVTTAILDEEAGREGSVQIEAILGSGSGKLELVPSEVAVNFTRVTQLFSDRRELSYLRPILVAKESLARTRIKASFDDHRNLFPAALCYTQIVPVDEVITLMVFYREDDHLMRLMLDDAQRARLNRLWDELHYVAQTSLQRVDALELLLEVMQNNGSENRSQHEALLPLRGKIDSHAKEFRQQLVRDESMHVDRLVEFAARAYRRQLSDEEDRGLRGLYQRLRDQELPHDDAFRLSLARVFVASPFLYRLEQARAGAEAVAISDSELASRLSYFLWSSQPDEALRQVADDGTLGSADGLTKQTRRMLADGRIRRLATEFACQWLHIHEFDSQGDKSEKYFPEFADLRGDMYEESIRFFTDLFQNDASLLSLLDADHSFVNERMAKFYGIEGVEGQAWRRVEGMRQRGRGGILGLATTLAKQSGAARTSPILRGNWVSEVLLGERLPRPPKDVPVLPADETATDGLTIRQLVAKHTSDERCASCHQRIDPFGFALERFDAIGRHRDRDLAGRPIDTVATLPDGTEIDGLEGLRHYLLETRREAFLRQFCRKLLGYAIGRELQLSDEPLLSEIQRRLANNDYRFSVAIETIVLSKQFREKRQKVEIEQLSEIPVGGDERP